MTPPHHLNGLNTDGGVDVREDAADWYLRARSDLVKSILDELDYDYSVGNYVLASENLRRQGYDVIKGPEDFICDLVVKEEMKEDEKSWKDKLDSPSKKERLEGRSERRQEERGKLEQRGREKTYDTSYLSTGSTANIVPDHHWQNRFKESSIHDFVSLFPDADIKEDSLYPNTHPFQKEHHPLLTTNVRTGLPAYIETLRDLYLPSKPGASSLAERIKKHEIMQENHHVKNNNSSVTGVKDSMTGETSHPFSGPIHDSHLYDLYLDNLENWKHENQDLVDSITKKYSNPEEQDFAIAQAHMDNAIKGWMNKDVNDAGMRTSLGWGGYNLGLEWLTPSQRNNVVEHLMNSGSTSQAAQKISIDGSKGKHISVGRIKRNLKHRFSPEFFQQMRGIIHTSQNQRKHVEGEGDVRDMNDHDYQLLYDALHDTHHEEHGNMANAIINALNEKHGGGGSEPLTSIHGLRSYPKLKQSLKSQDVIQALADTGENVTNRGVNRAALLHLLGLKQTKDGYEVNEKGHFNHSDRPLGVEDMKKLDETMVEKRIGLLKDKMIRNAESHSHTGFNGPHDEDIPEDENDLWMRTEHGAVGNGAIFSMPFIRGGNGRSSLAKLEMLHDWMPKDEEGNSLIGSVTPEGALRINNKNVGLFGSVVPADSQMMDSSSMGHHQTQSFWDASSHRKESKKGRFKNRNTKQSHHIGHSTLDPEIANTLGRLTRDERVDAIGTGDFTHRLEGRATSAHNPIMQRGQSATGIETRIRDNGRLSHNVHTRLGRNHPPHKPAKVRMLKHTEMKLPKNKQHRTHTGDARVFDAVHELSGKGRKDLPEKSTLEYQERLESALDEVNDLEDTVTMYAETGDEMPDGLMDELMAAKMNLKNLEEVESTTMTSGRGMTHHHKQFDLKMDADLTAITQMALKLKPIMEKEDPTAFDTTNKLKFLSNTSRLLHDANRMLMIAPNDSHGLTTYGPGIDEEKIKSASATASEITGNTIVPHRNMMLSAMQHGVDITHDMSIEDVMSAIGFDHDENDPLYEQHKDLAERLRDSAPIEGGLRAMTHGSLLSTGMAFHPRGQDISLDHETHTNHMNAFEEAYDNEPIVQRYKEMAREKARTGRTTERGKETKGLNEWFKTNYLGKLGVIPRLMSKHYKAESEKYGLIHLPMGDVDDKSHNKSKVKSLIHDIIAVDPKAVDMDYAIEPTIDTTETPIDKLNRSYGREIHPATSLKGANIGDYFVSGAMEMGYPMTPTVGIEWDGSNFVAGTNMPSQQQLHSISEESLNAIHGEDAIKQVMALPGQFPSGPNSQNPNLLLGGRAESDNPDDMGKSDDMGDTLIALMDPDIFIKSDDGKPLPILPMHRIFSVKDFEALRGFSGEWAASVLPDDERFIVRKKGNRVTAYDKDGDVALSPEDRKQLKLLNDKNWMLDAVKDSDEINIVDIIEYDDTNIADMTVRERLKVLRGQFDSHEHVIIPGPHNLRLTDNEGLETVVESLKESGERILLRDATSTYMRGERRHPKWFLLRPDKEVTLIILDVRGKGPFTYRLGAGPLDAEGFGNRGVEYEGKSYLDVGTVKSPKPFVEGDFVNVKTSGVKSRARNGKTMYDVAVSKIITETDDAPASLETLSLLTKSHSVIPVQFSIDVTHNKLTVSIPQVDDVIYKMNRNAHGTWAHSPYSTLADLQKNEYPILLAESLRPIWNQAASLMLKGAKVDIEGTRSMSNPKHRKQSEKESAGVIDDDDEMNILKPQMVKTLSRIANLVDKVAKEKMSGRVGAQGFGIDVGDGTESPRGPTSLTSEESLPDWDMLERPTEDPEEEYPAARSKRLKQKNREESNVYEGDEENE